MKKKYFLQLMIIIPILFASSKSIAQVDWKVNVSDFNHSLTMIGKINLTGEFSENPQNKIGAFVGEECRGITQVILDEELGIYMAYLMVYSNTSNEEIHFKIYDAENTRVIETKNTIHFVSDKKIGNDNTPFIWSANILKETCELLAFSIVGLGKNEINDEGKITFHVPQNFSLENLKPEFTLSEGARLYVNNEVQASGISTQSFSQFVRYTIISEDKLHEKSFIVSIEQADQLLGTKEDASKMELYPNPCANRLFVKIDDFVSKECSKSLNLLSLNGMKLYSRKIETNEIEINISTFPKGIYVLQVIENSIPISQKKLIIE